MKEKLVRNLFSSKTINRVKKKCELMGIEKRDGYDDILVTKLFGTLFLFFYFIFTSNKGYIIGPVVSAFFYYYVEYIYLDGKIRKRASKLDYEALFFFQVLTLSLESGKDLKGALELTCKNIESTVSKEFKKTIEEVDYGKSLNEALVDMKKRIPSETIRSVLVNITQSNVQGNSIVDSLNSQIEYIRNKKLLEIKGIINKMPLKISVLSVLFIIPIVLLLLLGPLLIKLVGML